MPIFSAPPAWVAGAICAQTDPEAFFPKRGETGEVAKRICATCPVTTACLDDALADPRRRGVWGGTSEAQRRRLRAERRRAETGQPRPSTTAAP